MRRLQASAATCWTTRTSSACPISAPIFVAPSLLAELIRTHATPFCDSRLAETSFPPFGVIENFMGWGFKTRLWKLSKTKATVLIPLALPVGTREGCTNNPRRFAAAGLTKKLVEVQPSDAHRIAM